jgi:hypothetical protein
VYEITLHRAPPASLTARFPTIRLHSAPTATVLSRRVIDVNEVDWLIEQLRSLGIAPLEVHASAGNYEFRIDGQLAESTLRYLQWTAHLDQERIVMRVFATPADLKLILNELASSGIGIDHFISRHAA